MIIKLGVISIQALLFQVVVQTVNISKRKTTLYQIKKQVQFQSPFKIVVLDKSRSLNGLKFTKINIFRHTIYILPTN